MRRAEYDELGATRPERAAQPGDEAQSADHPDITDALTGLPLCLESRLARGYGNETWLVRTTHEFCSIPPGQLLVAKGCAVSSDDSHLLFERSARTPLPSILSPLYCQTLPGDRLLTISPYLPLGSLRQLIRETRLTKTEIRGIVGQIGAALASLRELDVNRVLVHGDVKPENILVVARDPLQVCLSDFDHSRWVPAEATSEHGGMLTLRYAAPEAIGGLWSSASDMWSMGIMVLELLLGRHPFDGLSDESVRACLSTSWEMPGADALSDDWRALLLGVLDRNYTARWRPLDLTSWLRGDRETIARGLARGREQSAQQPLDVNGESIYTARSLARALVGNWNVGLRMLHSPDLGAWLRDSLGSAELGSRLQNLLENEGLSEEDRMIRFAYFAHPDLDPTWRDIRLTRATLQQLAASALENNTEAYQKLLALRDSAIVESYSSLGIHGPRQLLGDWHAGWQRYETGWQRLVDAGAPSVRPPDEAALPALARLWLSEDERQALAHRIEQQSSAVRYLLHRNWYFALGHNLPELPIEFQWILEGLDQSSLVETITYTQDPRTLMRGDFREPTAVTAEQLMSAVLFSATTERLTRSVVLHHASREETTLVGAQLSDQHLVPGAWDSYWTRLTAPLGRHFGNLNNWAHQWWARRRQAATRNNDNNTAPAATGETNVSISALRLDLKLPGKPNTPLGQIALIRWELPANSRPSIHIGHLGLFGRRITRQRIVRLPYRLEGAPPTNTLARLVRRGDSVGLPHRGQLVAAFFEPTIVWLQYRMPNRRLQVRSQVLQLGAPAIPLLRAAQTLQPGQPTFRENDQADLLIPSELAEVAADSVPVDHHFLPVELSTSSVADITPDRPIQFTHRRPDLQLPVEAYCRLLHRIAHGRLGRIGLRSNRHIYESHTRGTREK